MRTVYDKCVIPCVTSPFPLGSRIPRKDARKCPASTNSKRSPFLLLRDSSDSDTVHVNRWYTFSLEGNLILSSLCAYYHFW